MATAPKAGDVYFQFGPSISIPIKKLDELVKAILAIEREAVARGLR